MSLRRRLTLVLCALLLLPLVTAALLVGLAVPRFATQAADERLTTTARAAAATLASRCADLGEAARSLALEAGPVVGTDLDAQVAQDAVTALLRARPGASAAVLGPDGPVASAGPVDDLAGSAGLSCAAGDVGVAATGEAALVQSVPVIGTGSLGTVVVATPLDDDVLAALQGDLGLGSELVLVTDSGAVASTVPDEVAERIAVGTGDQAPASPVDVAGQRVVSDPGGRGLGLRVLAVEPQTNTSGLIGGVLALLAVAAVAAVATIVVLARRLTAPLVELTGVVGRLGGGDLEARTPVRGHDEVGRLGAAFNTMADTLVEAIVSARQGRAALDDSFQHFGRVLGRTHDLDGLVVTLLEASRSAAGAATGGAWLGDDPGMLRRVAGEGPHHEAMGDLAREAVGTRERVSRTLDGPVELVAYPLLHEDDVLGAVAVGEPEGGTFTPEAHAALQALSRQAGTAVHNVMAHRETQRLSVTDPLTGAGNFRHLSTTLAREVERASRFDRPLSVLMLDLDHFKSVNDSWGHGRGDTVLRELARRLGECVREVDTVARYGGEEFALVLPETDLEGAEMVAQRVVDSVGQEPFTAADWPPITVTVSVGLATFPLHGHSAGDVMRAADRALYVAKRSGRDQWRTASTAPEPATGGQQPSPSG